MYEPLVSISIPNYNYGCYLEHCLDSVLKQTYNNIEVILSDNASTDDSYEIALRYMAKFKERGFYFKVNENKRNVGSDRNSKIANEFSEGEFVYTLASDDAIKPDFIQTCVDIFNKYPNVGTVIVGREEIDENGNISKQIPFYNRSCIIKGEDQAAVYMMAGIAIPGQRMVRRNVFYRTMDFRRGWNVAGDWYDNFLYSMAGDVAYVKKDLMEYRVHSGNETNESEKKLLGIAEHYQLINAFADISRAFGYQKPVDRYEEAVKHLGAMCLRYTIRMLRNNEIKAGKKYFKLAPIFDEDIVSSEQYLKLDKILEDDDLERIKREIKVFEKENNMNRSVSYDPPKGWLPLEY